jgi:L-lactate utilization protein LutB
VLPVLRNPQLRKNVAHAIDVIQAKRGKLVAEKTDWQELRTAGAAIRTHALENLGATSNSLKSAARPRAEWFTGPPMPPRRGRLF